MQESKSTFQRTIVDHAGTMRYSTWNGSCQMQVKSCRPTSNRDWKEDGFIVTTIRNLQDMLKKCFEATICTH